MFNPVVAHIDLEALSNNLKKIKWSVPEGKILAMIKCNAYGHGVVEVARCIEQEVDVLGVMFLREAIQLKDAGINKKIVILTGFFGGEELEVIDSSGFECVIHNFEQIAILEKSKLTRPLAVWFKIDTGMHRLGFQPDQIASAYQRLIQHPMVQKPLRLMTHFSDADNVVSDKTTRQLSHFAQMITDFSLEGEWCLANSSTILKWPEVRARSPWLRPGITLYGVSPIDNITGVQLGLEPVMTLTSKIITIHKLEKGETVGYGGTFRCPEDMLIGTVAIGYGSGYPRNTDGAPILVDGVRTQLIGRVAMDMIGVDLRNVPNAKVGSNVVLWGRGLPVEEVAKYSSEIAYELFTRLTSRVQYKFYQQSIEVKV